MKPRFVFLVLVLGVLAACSKNDPPPEENPGQARLEAELVRGTVGEPMRFRCTAEDPRGERLRYSFDWGDGSGEVTDSEPVDSGVTAEVTRTFTREGSFQARCRAVKTSGPTGAWSEPVAYTVEQAEDTRAVSIETHGRGQVTSAPERVSCPGDTSCVGRFPVGTQVTLTATAEAGWRFVGWYRCAEGDEPHVLTLDADAACAARFAPEPESVVEWQRTGGVDPQAPVWSPDGTRLAAIDGPVDGVSQPGGPVRLWDAESGHTVQLLRPETKRYTSVAWSPSGHLLAAGRSDGELVLIDATTGKVVRQWSTLPHRVIALAWSPDGSRLATLAEDRQRVWFWNANSGAQEGAPLVASVREMRRLMWSPDGSRIALQGAEGRVELHAPGVEGPQAQWPDVASFTWSPDGQRYALGAQGEVRVHVTATHELETTLRGAWGKTTTLDWSRDGRWLGVGGAARTLYVLEAATGAIVADATDRSAPWQESQAYDALRFHPSRPALVVADSSPISLTLLTVDEAAHTVVRRELIHHFGTVSAVAWSPAGDRLASRGAAEGVVRLWDRDGVPLRTLEDPRQKLSASVAWDGTGTLVASGGEWGAIYIWRAADGTEVRRLRHVTANESYYYGVYDLALSPDGSRVATHGGSSVTYFFSVQVIDVATGARLARFELERTDSVRSLGWTPDSRYLVVGRLDGSWFIWDSQTGTESVVNAGLPTRSRASALSPDGTRIAVGAQPGLSIHDVSTGELLQGVSGGFEPYTLRWSPDGQRILGGGEGGQVFAWSLANGLRSSVVGYHDDSVSSVSWHPEGQVVTTGGTDSALVTWRPRP
ncbi:WD40 domain-containing protein [Pyxidicoccus xibeiensis]|uniref:WD40 domain-containing protein n=1 Tax=Pyxidicoccus xibeiensis TaxID=2906759 RepID=UPI0020A707BE|nr:WD40 repeat domain-containing protein [Pyxidicoccus xibeiensis]MCP3142256.1 WD40 repeat domain-containing protein [Pyxidicoccus xibeiensis]